jgi:hypothetical protein
MIDFSNNNRTFPQSQTEASGKAHPQDLDIMQLEVLLEAEMGLLIEEALAKESYRMQGKM